VSQRVPTQIGQPLKTAASPVSGMLQRKCACGQHTTAGSECTECGKNRLSLQRATQDSELETRNSGGVPPIVHDVLRSPGRPLDSATRAFMEPRFGHDFSVMPASASGSGSAPMPAHLAIGSPHDDFEQEAEMMAQDIVSRSATSAGKGYDFSGVRIHTDARAAESAQTVNALALHRLRL
jgi:hypothetical protein